MEEPASKKAKLDAWVIEAILDEGCTEEKVPAIEAKVAFIEDKRNISKAVQYLSSNWPLDTKFQFLKRVKATAFGAEIIVSIGSKSGKGWSPLDMPGLSRELCSKKVPSRPPLTRAQFNSARDLWPCHFHENHRLEATLAQKLPEVWGLELFRLHSQRMGQLVEKATSGVAFGAAFNTEGQKLAMAFETKTNHPLQHCAMNLIDCVAHAHGGGAWPSNVAFEEGKRPEEAYLLTGCDVYLSHEPCIMCSMALVHSRVGRVFFAMANASKGGLCSLVRLQNVKALNHTFEVYSMTNK